MKITALPKPEYPFPSLMSTYAEKVKAQTDMWIDRDYGFLPMKMQMKYKLSNFGYITARCLPDMPTYDHLKPAAMFMLWGTVFDDYYEYCTTAQLQSLQKRVVAVLEGGDPEQGEHDFFPLLADIRDRLNVLLPSYWMRRYIDNVDNYIGSMQLEVPFKLVKHFPRLEEFIRLRELTIGVHAFLDLIILQLGLDLPEEVMNHTYMKELYRLTARVFAWCNDFYSIEKDIDREPLNLVLVLQHEFKLSIEAANDAAMSFHDNDVREIVRLQSDVPDFGHYTNGVKKFAWYLGVMIQGQKDWYAIDTRRYQKGGFPEEDTFKAVAGSSL